jgi:hypothetical protein
LWSLASYLAYDQADEALSDFDGPGKVTLTLEPVSFTAKDCPRAGRLATYTKPVLNILGAAGFTRLIQTWRSGRQSLLSAAYMQSLPAGYG